ncbi:MAG TPA: hypothetical protein VFJ90_15220 [Candidatus Didemnitutus sp.]|nr:hypothetical protein [Candidatus Didemnitutus sp.]
MLLSLIFMVNDGDSTAFARRSLLGNCLFAGKSGHQRNAAGNQLGRQLARRAGGRAVTALERRGRKADAPREQRAETAEAGEADRHAHLGHGLITQDEQVLGAFDLRERAILVRRFAEHRSEKPDEMMRGYAGAARDVVHRRASFFLRPQPIAGEAQTTQQFVVQHTSRDSAEALGLPQSHVGKQKQIGRKKAQRAQKSRLSFCASCALLRQLAWLMADR